jgi:Fe-S cluster assembly scaffold protein SufB
MMSGVRMGDLSKIDADHVFYLKARGILRLKRSLIVEGFFDQLATHPFEVFGNVSSKRFTIR